MRTQRLEFTQGNSAKFWQIRVAAKKTIVTYGRIDSDGRVVEKEYGSAELAKAAALKLVDQKKLKGYKAVNANASKQKVAVSRDVKNAEKISAGKIIDVVGLVGHLGAERYFLGRTAGVAFTFLHWKFTKGEMIDGDFLIALKQNLVGRKYENALKRFQPYTIFRLKLKIERHPKQKKLIGVVQNDYGKADDKELKKMARQYQKPIVIKDPKLGTLKLDRVNRLFENDSAKWQGKKISVEIEADERAEYCPNAMKLLQKMFNNPAAWEKKAKQFAARELIDKARDWQQQEDDWQDSGAVDERKPKKPITLAEFKERIKLVSICAGAKGIVIWFDDDDIFFSHVIEVHVNPDGKFDRSDVTG